MNLRYNMGYTFSSDYNRNVILETGDGGKRNYGREFIVELPIVFWLAYKQLSDGDLWRGNLFGNLDLPKRIDRVRDLSSCSLDKNIEQALSVAGRLPGKIGVCDDLNNDLEMMDLNTFRGPDNEYKIDITVDSFDIWKDDDFDLSVSPEMLYTFAGSFYEMI